MGPPSSVYPFEPNQVVHHGFGQHAALLPLDDVILTLKLIYCGEIFYVFGISFIRFSVLLCYRRIFPNKCFEIVLWCIGGVLVVWMIAITLLFVFQCSSIAKAWDFLSMVDALTLPS